jgi:hypothetical protein
MSVLDVRRAKGRFPMSANLTRQSLQPGSPEAPVGTLLGRTDAAEGKPRTAAELAELIEADLARHPHCPRRGIQVTVYASTLWRAMLTITPAAGPLRNPREWRDLTERSRHGFANGTIWIGLNRLTSIILLAPERPFTRRQKVRHLIERRAV